MSSSKVPKAIFVYGTLRADWGPRGDRWGVLDDKESAVVYEYGHITGYVLKQNPRLEYPFIHADSASDSTKKVFGTLLSWPSGGADADADTQSTVFQNKLAHCDSIEGYNPEEPSCGKFYVAFKEGEGGRRRSVILSVPYCSMCVLYGAIFVPRCAIFAPCCSTCVLYCC